MERWSSMRVVGGLVLVSLCVACRRDAPSKISADPTPSSSTPPPKPKLAVHDEKLEKKGNPKISLAWPRLEVPDGAGAAISKSIEDDLHHEEKDVEDRWTDASKESGVKPTDEVMQWNLDVACTAPLVAYDVVNVVCDHSSYQGGAHEGFWTTSYAWTIDGGAVKSFASRELFDEPSRARLAAAILDRLKKKGATFAVDGSIAATDLLEGKMLDVFAVGDGGVDFLFSPYAVATWAEGPQSVHLDWSELHALAPASKLLGRVEAAAHAKDAIVAPLPAIDDEADDKDEKK